jgi:hypothetical protein
MDRSQASRLVERCLKTGPNAEALANLVASIDWSQLEKADTEVLDLLGKLEGTVTAYCEGDTSWDATSAALRHLISQPDARRASA